MVKLGLALALSVFLPLCAAQTPPAPDATTGKAAPNVTVTEARPQSARTRFVKAGAREIREMREAHRH